ncbi:uncharacterized protein B0T23DRAFT_348473 [Neurospora hispaniola]|uniref:Uncharacterized protein n=1 Tax=Neurospora hispaniola TaxID=588809 RepID=A0AAJ0IEA3_9PEZI|nr:hypothetical protein B0T23DRAFT_348473 [Neurospora hispaniola]
MPSINRKREWEGEGDGARPNKKSTASASTAKPASASNDPDPPVLIGPYDGHRRYDEWKGQMYGFPRVIPGSGALYPTNYQINFNHSDPWVAHRKLLLYDEVSRGFFWAIGERKTPDKDGKFRSIVVKRGYFEPDSERKRDDVRQPPENWESEVNPRAVKDIKLPSMPQAAVAPAAPSAAPSPTTPSPAASSSTTFTASASRPLAVPALATPRSGAAKSVAVRPSSAPTASVATLPAIRRTAPGTALVGRPTGNSIHGVTDISSDEEDVKPILLDTPVKNKTFNGAISQKGKAKTEIEGARSATKGQDSGNDLMDDDDANPFDVDPFEVLPRNMPGFNGGIPRQHSGSTQQPVSCQPSAQPTKNNPDMPTHGANSGYPEIWKYMLGFLQPGTQIPDDAAIAELLTLQKRRDLPEAWKFRLAAFTKHDLKTYTSVILYLGGTEAVTSPCSVMGCAHNEQTADYAASLQREDPRFQNRVFVKYAFPKCVFLPRHLLDSVPLAKRLKRKICANSYYRKQSPNHKIQNTKEQALEALVRVGRTIPGSQMAQSSSANVPRIITPVAFSTTKSDPQRVEAQRGTQSSGGNEADTQEDSFQDNPILSKDPVRSVHNHNGSTRQTINHQFPEIRPSMSEQSQRSVSSDIWAYITQFARTPTPRPDDEAITELLKLPRRRDIPGYWRRQLSVFSTLSLHQLTAVIWYLGGDASLPKGAVRPTYIDEITATKSYAIGNTMRESTTLAILFSNLAIHNKPRATHQQQEPKQASTTSQRPSGIFSIPENTPGQMFSLKGTNTKIIQSSRNQILKCKVLAGDGIKWQIVGGKEFKAYKSWIDEWEIPPDSQCLVKNIHPKRSFGENQTCIDVNPKKGVVKAAQNQRVGK